MDLFLKSLALYCGDISMLDFLLFVLMLATICVLIYCQCRKDGFDLRWLILDDITSKPSIHKIGQFVALVISSWGMIYQIKHNNFSETFLGIYMGVWAGSTALNRVLDNQSKRDNNDHHDDDDKAKSIHHSVDVTLKGKP